MLDFKAEKIAEPVDTDVIGQVFESRGSDWLCFLQSGQMGYKPCLMYRIDFEPIEPTEEMKSVKGHIKYGARRVAQVDLVFPRTAYGSIDVQVTLGERKYVLEGVQSEEETDWIDISKLVD